MHPPDDRIRDCPHCFGRVMVTSNNRCPACWGDTTAPNESGRARMRINVDDNAPNVCIVCGEATTRGRKIKDTLSREVIVGPPSEKPRDQTMEFASGVLKTWVSGAALLFGGRLPIFKRRKGPVVGESLGYDSKTMQVTVPCCRRCRKVELKVLDADHFERTMVLAVHERFRDSYASGRNVIHGREHNCD